MRRDHSTKASSRYRRFTPSLEALEGRFAPSNTLSHGAAIETNLQPSSPHSAAVISPSGPSSFSEVEKAARPESHHATDHELAALIAIIAQSVAATKAKQPMVNTVLAPRANVNVEPGPAFLATPVSPAPRVIGGSGISGSPLDQVAALPNVELPVNESNQPSSTPQEPPDSVMSPGRESVAESKPHSPKAPGAAVGVGDFSNRAEAQRQPACTFSLETVFLQEATAVAVGDKGAMVCLVAMAWSARGRPQNHSPPLKAKFRVNKGRPTGLPFFINEPRPFRSEMKSAPSRSRLVDR